MSENLPGAPLLPTDFLKRLERLSIGSRRRLRGNVMGVRRSVRHGASVEFTDYRDYMPGDDLRYVDWKAYARLSKLLVRLFTEEDDISLHLLVDSSASMRFGDSISKLLFAQRLAAALGIIALSSYDRCTLASLPLTARRSSLALVGRGSIALLLRQLESLRPSGTGRIASGLTRFAVGKTSPGVIVVISDFYDHDLTPALLARLSRRHSVVLAHIADPSEIDPSASLGMDGDEVRLIDSETGAFIELTLTPSVLESYRKEFADFCERLQTLAKASGATYLRISTDTPVEDVVLGSLRENRVLE